MSRATLLLAIIVPAALFFPPPVAAQPGRNRPDNGEAVKRSLNGDGSEFFRALLHIRGVKPVKEKEFPIHNYDDVIVIVVGDPNLVSHRMVAGQHVFNPVQLQSTLISARHGGAILIASSNNLSFQPKIPNFSIVTGVRVESNDPRSILAGHRDCPFAVPIPRPLVFHDPQSAVRRLFDGDLAKPKKLERVVAGTPSFILLKDPRDLNGVTGLAGFPRRTFEMTNARIRGNEIPEEAFFAVGGDLDEENTGPYRFLAMASSHVFNNALMYRAVADQPDDTTDNLELCIRTIEYLEGPSGQRKRCIFFENGQLIEHFDDLARATSTQSMPMPKPNMDAIQKMLVDWGNQQLDQVQSNDLPNKWINNWLGLPRIMAWVLWAAGLSALLFMIQRLFGSRKPSDPEAPRILPASSQPPGVFERRQKELLRRNNVYEPVRDLIRDFFHSVGIEEDPGLKIPKLVISDSVRKPDSLRVAIKDLWRLAFGPPQVVNVSFWRELEPYFLRVCEAHNEGKWAFAFEKWDMG